MQSCTNIIKHASVSILLKSTAFKMSTIHKTQLFLLLVTSRFTI